MLPRECSVKAFSPDSIGGTTLGGDVPVGICRAVPISNPGLTATQNIIMLMPDGTSFPVRSQTITVAAPGAQSFEHGTMKNNVTSPTSGSDISAQR